SSTSFSCISLVVDFGDRLLHLFLVLCGQLLRSEFVIQPVDCPVEAERQVVAEVHWRSSIDTDVEGFVDGHHERDRVRNRLAVRFLAIDREYADTTFAWSGSVVLEVKDDGVLARTERWPGPPEALQIQQVVNEDRSAPANLRNTGDKSCD